MKIEIKFLSKLILLISLSFVLLSCEEDEIAPKKSNITLLENDTIDFNVIDSWQTEIFQLRNATAKYANIKVAESEGFIDVSGFVPNMGHHYLLPSRVDNTFELEKPEIILYTPNEIGEMEFVGVEYVIPIADLNNPGSPPEGFKGSLDEWEINTKLSQWQLHVWIVKENPAGIFKTHNIAIGDRN